MAASTRTVEVVPSDCNLRLVSPGAGSPSLMSMADSWRSHMMADAEHPAREHDSRFWTWCDYPNAREQRPANRGLALSFFRWKHGASKPSF